MANNMMEERATFSAMEHGTKEDWAKVAAGKKQFSLDLPNRLIAQLELLKEKHWGFPIDRYAHCLQSATLAHRAGMDEEYVACALFHDIGYSVGPWSHAEVAAGQDRLLAGPRVDGYGEQVVILRGQPATWKAGPSGTGLAHVVTNCAVVAYATAPQFEAAPDLRAVP